jgi:RimJ/RimL family protein N-acetyltransferase
MQPIIRSLTEADAQPLFDLRREALTDSPFSFSASPEDDVWTSADAVREQLLRVPRPAVFGAFDASLIGMLGVHRAVRLKERHKALIWGVYVAPQSRGQGIARLLIEAAIAYVSTLAGATSVYLSVSERAPAAQHLYEKCGFKVWGVEPDALRHEGESSSERHMILSLTARG